MIFFWTNYCCKYLNINIIKFNKDIYDNFLIKDRDKMLVELIDIDTLYDYYYQIKEKVLLYLFKSSKLNNFEKYILRFTHLLNDKVNEDIIESLHFFSKNFIDTKIIYDKKIVKNIEYIYVPEGNVLQGTNNEYNDSFYYDNEYPSFNVKLNSFKISKYCITNYQYLQFVSDNGYSKKKYWSFNGWRWVVNKKLKHPIFWQYDKYYKGKEWREKIFNKYHILRMNYPVVNISYYEAEAYCNWVGGRLPRESEWEYLSDFFEEDYKNNGHFNYNNGTTISVLEDKNINKLKIVGLFGNVWEWCLESFYPYDGFKKELLYKEYSYPYFGRKGISKGGSWCVPKYLVSKSYRNFIDVDCCHKFIGFRVVRKN